MRIILAVLGSIVTMGLAVPALAQGFAGCPPGLAMKGNGCLPPGQAYAPPPRPVYVVGQPLPPTVVYQPVPPVLVERLEPVPPGYGYVQVDNDVLLMNMADRLIADTVMDLSGLD